MATKAKTKQTKTKQADESEMPSINPVSYMRMLRRAAGMSTTLSRDAQEEGDVYVRLEFTREQVEALEELVRHTLYKDRALYEEVLEESGATEAAKTPYAMARKLAELVDIYE